MDERFYAEYFRVAFYGNFPVALRNKQFIVCLETHWALGLLQYLTCPLVPWLRVGETRCIL